MRSVVLESYIAPVSIVSPAFLIHNTVITRLPAALLILKRTGNRGNASL
jgi:hypothetical protein